MRSCRLALQCVVFGVLGIVGYSGTIAFSQSPDQHVAVGVWRRAEWDGVNCLYLQMRVLGVRLPYEKFLDRVLAAEDVDSFAGLEKLGRESGCSVITVRSSFKAIREARVPIVAHMEDDTPGRGGGFVLLLGFNDGFVSMIDGRTVGATQMSEDEFRRAWSGYALVPAQDSWSTFAVGLLVLSLIVVAHTVIKFVWRNRVVSRTAIKIPLLRNAWLFLLLVDTSLVAAELPKDVQQTLERQAEELSPVSVFWTSSESFSASAPAIVSQRREGESHGMQQYELSWQDGKIYYSYDYAKAGKERGPKRRLRQEFSFDGEFFYTGRPDSGEGQPTLNKYPVANPLPDQLGVNFLGNEYFVACGYRLPTGVSDFQSSLAKSEVLAMLASGADMLETSTANVNGQPLLRVALRTENPLQRQAAAIDLSKYEQELRRGPADEKSIQAELQGVKKLRDLPPYHVYAFFLDPEMEYTVRQREARYPGGRLLLRGVCEDFEQIQGRKLWLPRKCTTKYFADRRLPGMAFDEALRVEVINVTEISLNAVPDERFALRYLKPGTYVTDRSLPEASSAKDGAVSYTVPANPEDLDRTVAEARAIARGANPGPSWRRLFVIANVIALTAFLLTYVGWRWRRRNT